MEQVIAQLKGLGFSQYEALAYVTLLQHQPLNGYELAKFSGIPRANIYTVLKRLEEQGAAARIDNPARGSTLYAPVPVDELLKKIQHKFEQSFESASQSLKELQPAIQAEYVWSARGYQALIEHASAVLQATRKDAFLAVWPEEAQALEKQVEAAEKEGVQVTTLCLAGCPQPCGSCKGSLYRYHAAGYDRSHWLLLVSDGNELLAGEVSPSQGTLAIRTGQKMMVELASWYIRHSIALALILKDAGVPLERALSEETLAVLDRLGPKGGPEGEGTGWLAYMRSLIERRD
jgi:predicted transcriptional regulator